MGMGERRFFLAECGSRWDPEESRDGGAKERVDSLLSLQISSRIVATTNIQSIDNVCSTADGYVYKIGKLNTEYSKDLFFQSASVEDCSLDMHRGSE
uniref:Uncharacterized protein n=1 Tax=Oryza nivara TaxID=4536 RepID=A0A0E0IR76_ORYNI